MLFAARNGRPEHPVEDSSEVDVVQRLACGLGPAVDGMAASRSLPQAMGAFVTYGAQGACAGREQQAEQHAPTTFQPGLGQTLAPTASTSPFSPTTTSQTMLTKAIALRTAISPTLTTKPTAATAPEPAAPAAPTAPATPTPDASAAATPHPPGTITAFSPKLNMWRVAFPVAAPTAGFGIFSAAATFVEQAPQAAPNPGDTQVPEKELEAQTGQLPFYKKPLFWAIVAGGVVVLGGGTFFLVRRRRKKAATPAPALPKAAYY